MKYLTGSTNDAIQPSLVNAGIGLMCQPGNGYHHRIEAFPFWAADIVGMNNNNDPEKGLDWLDRLPRTALFVVSPDAFPSAEESLRRGLEYAPVIREMGFPVAVVAQDGAENLHWPWEEMDCLFIGGKPVEPAWAEWKESAEAKGLAAQSSQRWMLGPHGTVQYGGQAEASTSYGGAIGRRNENRFRVRRQWAGTHPIPAPPRQYPPAAL